MSAAVMEAPAAEVREIRPQPGPQELFLSTPADIGIMGGSVYGGKTWSLIYEPLRHVAVPGFTFVLFRRVKPEITNPGGMWDESLKWYPLMNGESATSTREWYFPSGAYGKMAGLQYEDSVEDWKGAQVCLIGFDQLEEFTERQFFYMLSRNRSTCGVRPYVRASCNPNPDSFLADFLSWWIDDDGYAIPERSGVIRWFIRVDDTVVWSSVECAPEDYDRHEEFADRATQELEEQYPGHAVSSEGIPFTKSVTFVLARLKDNRIGVKEDPTYEGNVRAMGQVDSERLLGSGDRGGNWKIRPGAGLVFSRSWFEIVDAAPADARRVRAWDLGGTEGAGDWTAGCRMSKRDKTYYIEDMDRGQWGPGRRDGRLKDTTQNDGVGVTVRLPQDPAQAGKSQIHYLVQLLAGYPVKWKPVSGDKVVRASPLASQAKAGNVKLVRGTWNEAFLKELHAFPTKGVPDDQVDAAADAFDELALGYESAGGALVPM